MLDEQRSELMQSALTFDGTTVQEVLTPRVDLVAVNIDDPPQKIKELILGERFSRMPFLRRILTTSSEFFKPAITLKRR